MAKARGIAFRRARKADRARPRHGSVVTYTLAAVANKLRVTCAVPVVVSGMPRITASGGAHVGAELPVSVTVVNPITFDLGYAHNVAAMDTVGVPSYDKAVRSQSSGFLKASQAVV